MPPELLNQVVDTDYGQLDLVWRADAGYDGEDARFFAGQVNGLVGASDSGGVNVSLARRSGGSSVRIVLHQSAPPLDDDWEDVVEVSTTVPADAEPAWVSWAGETSGPLELPSGDYRLRVCCRGRDAGRHGEFEDDVVDFYLIELWPAAASPDVIVRSTSADAQYWHEARGTRT